MDTQYIVLVTEQLGLTMPYGPFDNPEEANCYADYYREKWPKDSVSVLVMLPKSHIWQGKVV